MSQQPITLPAGTIAGSDWNTTLQNIVAYGASRYFDSKAVENIYKSTPVNYMMDDEGTIYPAGTKAPSSKTAANTMAAIPPIVWIAGIAVVAVFLLKD